MQGTLLSTWDDTQMNSGNLKSRNALTVVEMSVGNLPSLNCILHTTPSAVQFENKVLGEMYPNINT